MLKVTVKLPELSVNPLISAEVSLIELTDNHEGEEVRLNVKTPPLLLLAEIVYS